MPVALAMSSMKGCHIALRAVDESVEMMPKLISFIAWAWAEAMKHSEAAAVRNILREIFMVKNS